MMPQLSASAVPVGANHLQFELGGVQYGVPLRHVRSVEVYRPPTPLPFAPGWLAGLTASAGEALAAIDLAEIAGAPAAGECRRTVILDLEGRALAVPVERIGGIRRLDPLADVGHHPGGSSESGDLSASGGGDGAPAATQDEAMLIQTVCPDGTPISVLSVPTLFQLLEQRGEMF